MSADYNDADHLVRKTAALQETRAPGTLLARRGRGGILSPQDLARARDFVAARAGGRARGGLLGDALGAQVVGDPRRAVLAGQLVCPRFGVALIRELLASRQLVEQPLECLGRLGAWRELARQLAAGMLAPGEQT